MFPLVKLSVLGLSLLLLGSRAVAAEAAAPVLPVMQFVDETTFVVADINVAALDLDAARTWLGALLKQGGLPEKDLADYDKHSGEGLQLVKTWHASFVKAGGTHLFVVASLAQDPRFLVVAPVAAGGNADALKQVFSELPRDMTRMLTMETMGNLVLMAPAETLKSAKETAANPQRTPRPELATALAAAGNSTIRIGLAIPEQMKGALIIQQPTLPPELGGGGTAPVVNAFKYMSVSLDAPTAASPKVNLRVTVQARDAAGAQKLNEISQKGMKLLVDDFARHVVKPPPEVIEAITPKLAGDQLTINLDQAKLEGLSKTVVKAVAAAQQQAKRMQSMSNMRQILVGTMMFANENKGNMPNRLPDDVRKYLEVDPDRAKQIWTNPVTGRHPGYIYVRPAEKVSQIKNSTEVVTLYEAYDQWPAGGIGVGFADGHVETVADEAKFKALLGNK
jgi:prepilin-type processing-associated H-X9-DG protein